MRKQIMFSRTRVVPLVAIACVVICIFAAMPLLVLAGHTNNTNVNGQTYGTIMDATSMDTCADLLAAIGDDGTEGYVLATDLWGKRASTPEEALALNKDAWKSREIPLYASNGNDIIGTFTIYPPAKVIETQEDGTTIERYPDGKVATTGVDGVTTYSIEER